MFPSDPPSPDLGLGEAARVLAQSATRTGRMGKLALKVHALADARISELPLAGAACAKGCAHCCRRLVSATLPEAIAIAEHIESSFTLDERASLLHRFGEFRVDVLRFLRRESAFKGVCPFLVEERCSVYHVRPLVCRGSFSEDAAECAKWVRGDAESPLLPAPMAVSQSLTNGIVAGTHAGGFPSGAFDLASTVAAILDGGAEAYRREGVTAEVERFVFVSPLYDEKMGASEGFAQLLAVPAFVDFWSAALAGDRDSARNLLPMVQDRTLSAIASLDLPSLYDSQDELEETWAALESAVEEFENTKLDPALAFDRLPALVTFQWPYTGKDVRPLLERVMRKVSREVVAKAHPHLMEPIVKSRKPGRFRVGYLSGNLTHSNGSYWAAGWLAHQSPDIETFAFNLGRTEDEFTNYWRRLAHHYFHLPIPVAHSAAFIRELDLDALIITDIGMNRFDPQISCLRIARRQFTAWGHPVTTGSPSIDGYLSSELMEPANGQSHYSERLIRLPNTGLCYPRVIRPPADVDPTQFGLPSRGFYFEGQNASKRLPAHDFLYRTITEASGKPIAFIEPAADFNRDKLARRLKRSGVNAVIVPRLPSAEFLGLMAKADAVLDTPSWNGGNSTIAALTLGKPVVSLATEFMRGRHCLAFMGVAGVPGLIAKDFDDYVSLAMDFDRQAAAMEGLDASRLYEDLAPVAALEKILLEESDV